MEDVIKIVNDIKEKKLKPIYFLMGEEPYYIDKISDYIEQHVLTEEEKGFNQSVYYGRDVAIEDIVSASKRYPMMADRQVVIVKEAQDLKNIEKLEAYAEQPMPTTILVFCYKYKTLDKRKKVTKLLEKHGLVFESKKLYENQVGDWIKRILQSKNYAIEPKAASMLGEFLGTDLSKISNELEKLQIILPKGSTITPKDIEYNIGFSKDYNVFELRKAIGEKNQLRAYKITKYFAENPKEHNITGVIPQLFSFFLQLLKYHGLKDKNPKNVAQVLGINPYFLKEYDVALKHYPMKKVSQIINTLRDIDVKSKGVGANALPASDLFKELLAKIFE